MRGVTNSLNAHLRGNAAELDRRLSQRQRFPLVSDGPKTRQILADIEAFEAGLEKEEEFDPKEASRKRLNLWRSLVESRYEEWREENAP